MLASTDQKWNGGTDSGILLPFSGVFPRSTLPYNWFSYTSRIYELSCVYGFSSIFLKVILTHVLALLVPSVKSLATEWMAGVHPVVVDGKFWHCLLLPLRFRDLTGPQEAVLCWWVPLSRVGNNLYTSSKPTSQVRLVLFHADRQTGYFFIFSFRSAVNKSCGTFLTLESWVWILLGTWM
jgi:hypothetical protein